MAFRVYTSVKAFCLPSPAESQFRARKPVIIKSAASKMGEKINRSESPSKLMEFPHLSASHRVLMVDLIHAIEDRLENHLLPCTLPPDVEYYQNQTGTSQGSLLIRSGSTASPINFILGSWLHSKLPTGGALNITTLSTYLRPSTDAPNFLLEFIQTCPTSLILVLDMSPRKDLALHPDYLKSFYEDTKLDTYRQTFEKIPEFRPYILSSLYFRSTISPTAITVSIETESGGSERMEEIIKKDVDPIVKAVLNIWLDQCACGEREVEKMERVILERRDRLIMSKGIEIDLDSTLPRLFGQEIADRVVAAIRQASAA